MVKPDPPAVRAVYERALAAHRDGDFAGARRGYQGVLAAQSDHAGATAHLGVLVLQAGQVEQARALLTSATELDPEVGMAWHNRARADEAAGALEQALVHYQRAQALLPDNPDTACSLANTHLALGDFAAAESIYRSTLAGSPHHGPSHRQLARLRQHDADDDDRISAMEATLAEPGVSDTDRLHTAFGLGKAYEDLGRDEEAFACFTAANRIMRGRLRYDMRQWQREVDSTIDAFTPDLLERLGNAGDPHARPVFILGMPRSGTSLVEQVLAAHSQVHGGGELQAFQRAVMAAMDTRNFHRELAALAPGALAEMARRYLAATTAIGGGALRITDKKPDNFKLIGLIRLVFPRAVVLHCVRDPRDLGLSLYRNLFGDNGPFYSYDLADIGSYHAGYARLMAHWRALLPGFVHDVVYEELVANPEDQARRLVDLCGLQWDDACLAPHRAQRGVQTASAVQVRQPVYRTSVEGWRRYETQLAPLFAALDD